MKITDFSQIDTTLGSGSVSSGPARPGDETKKDSSSFGDMLEDAVESVNSSMQESGAMIRKMASGEDVDIADTMISVSKAGISFQMLLQVRNKALSAYEEIMRMQV